jgi:hypothetical protein
MGPKSKPQADDRKPPARGGAPDVPRLPAHETDRARSGAPIRFDTPANRVVLVALVGLVLAAPLWILQDELRGYALLGDDFAYIHESRTWAETWRHLLTPHNTHIVPLFRLWTLGLVTVAGRLEDLPMVCGAAAYLGLVVAVLAVGRLVALETGRPAITLAAMAVLAISTVTHPGVIWYSAGQALWAGTAIVVTILLARRWLVKGGIWRLGLVALSAIAAPMIWTGGLLAGPAAIAYLWVKDRKRAVVPSLILIVVMMGFVLLLLILSRSYLKQTEIIWEEHWELVPRPIQAILHTCQAIIEALVLGNLGLGAITTNKQAFALTLALAAVWVYSHRGYARIHPLEAAGATMVLGSLLLVYIFRGNLPYSSLRDLGWYREIGQLGAVLFGAGWWAAVHPNAPARLTLAHALGLVGLVILLCTVHAAREQQSLIAGAPPMGPGEAEMFPAPYLQALRGGFYKLEHHDRQVRTLARLDRVDRLAQQLGADPETLRSVFGRVLMPGIQEQQVGTDVFSLLTPLPKGATLSPEFEAHRQELADLLHVEPPIRPDWLMLAKPGLQAPVSPPTK